MDAVILESMGGGYSDSSKVSLRFEMTECWLYPSNQSCQTARIKEKVMAIEIEKAASAKKTSANINININLTGPTKVTAKDRMFFIEQLALMIETGSDLHTSLDILQQQVKKPELIRVISDIRDKIGEGKTFSSAMAKHPEVFSGTYVSLIEASESGGYLQRILEHLVEMEKQRDELNTSLISAVSYPAFLMVFSVAMVIFILVVVFPKFAEMFVAIQDQLPSTTLFLMAASHIIIDYWWAILLGISVLAMGCSVWLKSESGNQVVASFKLKAPGIKHIFIKIYLIQIMRVLGLSLKHGVNLVEALGIARDVAKNHIFHQFVDGLIDNINDGKKLAFGFNEAVFIPPMVKQMIATGEETGNLALVSTRIADYFQKELEKQLQLVTKAIEPIMLIVMGVIVGVLVSSLILPIFKLSHAVH